MAASEADDQLMEALFAEEANQDDIEMSQPLALAMPVDGHPEDEALSSGPLCCRTCGGPSSADLPQASLVKFEQMPDLCPWCSWLVHLFESSPERAEQPQACSPEWGSLIDAMKAIVGAGAHSLSLKLLRQCCHGYQVSQTESSPVKGPAQSAHSAASCAGSSTGVPDAATPLMSYKGPSPIKSLSDRFSENAASPGNARPLFGGLRRLTSRSALEATTAPLVPALAAAEDETDTWNADLPITKESIDAPLPPGQVFLSMRKIRETINKYNQDMSEIGWLCRFRIATVQALSRRFDKHAPLIVGGKAPSVNIEVGYKQLQARVAAVVSMKRGVKRWLDHQNDMLLVDILSPLSELDRFMQYNKYKMASDINIMRCYATFHSAFKQTTSLFPALETINLHDLTMWCNECLANHAWKAPLPEDGEVPQDAHSPPPKVATKTAGKATKKGKTKRPPTLIGDRIPFDSPASYHVTALMSEGLKMIISHLPAQPESFIEDIPSMTTDMQVSYDKYINMGFVDPDCGAFAEALRSCCLLFGCAQALDADKPPTASVRQARKNIFAFAKGGGPAAEVSKALLTYPAGREVLELSKVYSTVGIEDDSAEQLFRTVVNNFESSYEQAFEDLALWLSQCESSGEELPLNILFSKLAPLEGMTTSFSAALTRWSVGACERLLPDAIVLVCNIVELLKGSLVHMMRLLASHFRIAAWKERCAVLQHDSGSDALPQAPNDLPPVLNPEVSAQTEGMADDDKTITFHGNYSAENPGAAMAYVKEAAVAAEVLVRQFEELTRKVLSNLVANLDALAGKLGDLVFEKVEAASQPSTLLDDSDHNFGEVHFLCIYLQASASVASFGIDGFMTQAPQTDPAYLSALVQFARNHQEKLAPCQSDGGIILKNDSGFLNDDPLPQSLMVDFCHFLLGFGCKLYDAHASKFLQAIDVCTHLVETCLWVQGSPTSIATPMWALQSCVRLIPCAFGFAAANWLANSINLGC